MAKQIGIFKISGTIDGLNFYQSNGKMIVRKSGGGFNGQRIKNSPEMSRVRENAAEFGCCAKVKKDLLSSLQPFYQYHHDPSLHSRMMQLLQKIKALDEVSAPGQRSVANGLQRTTGQQQFRDFAFSPKRKLMDLMAATGTFDPEQLSYSFTDLSAEAMQFPAGATHAELLYGILQLDTASGAFSLLAGHPRFLSRTDHFDLLRLDAGSLVHKADFNFAFCCIRFYDQAGARLYALKDLNHFALEVVAAF